MQLVVIKLMQPLMLYVSYKLLHDSVSLAVILSLIIHLLPLINSLCNYLSSLTFLISIAIPVITIDFVQVTVEVLSSALLPCYIQPDESITITWSFNGNPLTLPFPGRQLLQNGSLLIQSVAKSQEGDYICTASNSIGSDQGTIQLEVQGGEISNQNILKNFTAAIDKMYE